MPHSIPTRLPHPAELAAFQPTPASVGLAALVALLTVVPLDANPTLRKVVSVKMNLEDILHGAGEVFEIRYDAA
jgi:hypothetical protein